VIVRPHPLILAADDIPQIILGRHHYFSLVDDFLKRKRIEAKQACDASGVKSALVTDKVRDLNATGNSY